MSSKLKKNQANQQNKKEQDMMFEIVCGIVAFVGCLLCILLPLYLEDGYYHVGSSKYNIYSMVVWIGFALITVFGIVYAISYDWKKKIIVSATDICVLFFIPLAFMAAIIGGNFNECLQGYEGWSMGIIALLSFALLYYFFSRFGEFYKVILVVLICTTFLVMGIGVLHRLLIDPIGVYTDIDDVYKNQSHLY